MEKIRKQMLSKLWITILLYLQQFPNATSQGPGQPYNISKEPFCLSLNCVSTIKFVKIMSNPSPKIQMKGYQISQKKTLYIYFSPPSELKHLQIELRKYGLSGLGQPYNISKESLNRVSMTLRFESYSMQLIKMTVRGTMVRSEVCNSRCFC